MEDLQWDHVIPLSRDGMHCITNLQRLCRKCNERKHVGAADYRTEIQKVWVIEFERKKESISEAVDRNAKVYFESQIKKEK